MRELRFQIGTKVRITRVIPLNMTRDSDLAESVHEKYTCEMLGKCGVISAINDDYPDSDSIFPTYEVSGTDLDCSFHQEELDYGT